VDDRPHLPDGLDRPGWSHFPNLVVAVSLATGASLAMIASQRLYLARVCSVRAVETVRLGRTAVLAALLLQAGERRLGIHVSSTSRSVAPPSASHS